MASMVSMAGICHSMAMPSTSVSRSSAMLNSLPLVFTPNSTVNFYIHTAPLNCRMPSSRVFQHAVSDPASLPQIDLEVSESKEDEGLPKPVVIIDQESDPDATVVELSFGNRLGALLDTMQALKELGLNVERSRITVEGPVTRKRFSITRVDNGRKIEDPELLEAIRLTIINNMIEYHPESSSLLAMGNAFGIKAPEELDVDIATHIRITDEGPHESLVYIETADRPGLLREIVKVMSEINVEFRSGEFDTEGLVAKSKFHVNYRGAALSKSMKQVLSNCFQYYLRRPDTNVDSY
ncbi:hypothetical protein KP509_01G055000 [Ceratopteris richardii]|uniref:Uncharacterized protein n=1 Tax=Ceratopteris richardii TaxID=49495 RepID=A0A8T2VD55_CERRI|nr:hypothetical protein KP509_01G055000 [Ceratopteris richardii]KAH7446428.1 hypothetical protein KP509_01G055000 [Ceratopteris richardii]KAH7446429.1 hypothetical protein KP509_01G055000 [Ceratopteris richardii]